MPESTLNLSLDRESEIPVATQLAWKLRAQIAAGAITTGARLPGVRELAEAAKINVNTARTVYGRLEDEGLIRSEQGRGTFVADRAQSGGDLARIVAEAATAARQSGLDPREVAAALFADISYPPQSGAGTGGAKRSDPSVPSATTATAGTVPSVPAGGDAARRRGLREQIAQLERELAFNEEAALRAESDEPGSAEPVRRARGGRLLSANELELVRDELLRRLADSREEVASLRAAAAAAQREEAGEDAAPRPRERAWRGGGVWTSPVAARVVWTGS